MKLDIIDATGLVQVEPAKALALFTAAPEEAFGAFVTRVQLEVSMFAELATADTAEGRKTIEAMAKRIAKSRTHIEVVGKKLAAEQKDIPRKIDASRKYVRDALERLEEEVRQPLTDWECLEKERVERHRWVIDHMRGVLRMDHGAVTELRDALMIVDGIDLSQADEFELEYRNAKRDALAFLPLAIEAAEKREREAAELIKLRSDAEGRRRLDQEADIAAQAEQRARQLATDAADREANEAAVRSANKEHRATINRVALAAFVAGEVPDDIARRAVELISCGKIPAVRIIY